MAESTLRKYLGIMKGHEHFHAMMSYLSLLDHVQHFLLSTGIEPSQVVEMFRRLPMVKNEIYKALGDFLLTSHDKA